MTCHLHRCTNLPEPGYIERGTRPKKPVQWRVNYLIKTPDGKTHIENTVIKQPVTIPELLAIMDKMIDRGDWIRTTDLEGTVERVGLRATRVRQFDKALVTVPNSMLVDRALINFTRMTNRRIYWKIGVEYRTSQEQLQAIIKEISDYVHGNEAFETDPNRVLTFVFLDSFGDSSINIMLYCFTKTTVWGEWLSAKQDLAYEIKKIVERNGAAFAFPSTSLYVESLPFGTPEAFPGTDSDPSSLPPQAGSDPAQ